jgi:hypothetical protein
LRLRFCVVTASHHALADRTEMIVDTYSRSDANVNANWIYRYPIGILYAKRSRPW